MKTYHHNHGKRLSSEDSEGLAPDRGLSRWQRLTRPSLFAETYKQGRRWVGRYMILWLREGEDASLRLGVVASRKVGRAVDRVRAKRRLREVYRCHRHRLVGAWDVVLIARSSICCASEAEVAEDFFALAQRAGLIVKRDDS